MHYLVGGLNELGLLEIAKDVLLATSSTEYVHHFCYIRRFSYFPGGAKRFLSIEFGVKNQSVERFAVSVCEEWAGRGYRHLKKQRLYDTFNRFVVLSNSSPSRAVEIDLGEEEEPNVGGHGFMDTVHFRANRILRRMKRYYDLSMGEGSPAELPPGLNVQTPEVAIGIYINQSQPHLDAILITNTAIYIVNGQEWNRTAFAEIRKIVFPPSKKDVIGLSVERRDGSAFWLPVAGVVSGRFYDAFEMMRFLDRVCADIAEANVATE